MLHLAIFLKFYRVFLFPEKKIILSLFGFVFLLPQSLFSQEPDNSMRQIRARLINSRTNLPVVFANVINKNLRFGVLSDSLGVFRISARFSDTLYIKSISYYPVSLPVSDSLVWQFRIPLVPMTEQVYDLGSIDVYGWGSYQEFKYKVLNTPIPEDNMKKVTESIHRKLGKIPKHPLQEQASIPLGSPITGLYMLFSKEGKSIRRYQAAKERDRVFLLTYQKFNRDVASIVTGLTGSLLDQFMAYCRPDDEFLLHANEYEIHLRILNDYERFKNEIIVKQKK